MNRFNLLLFSLLFSVSSIASNAMFRLYADEREEKVSGIVTDNEGNPLADVIIAVEGTTITTGTNSKGEFRVGLYSNHSFVLNIHKIGWKSQHIQVPATGRKALSVVLQPSRCYLEEVVVTGMRRERPLKDVPVITRVISREEIETINPSDLTQLLENTLPGIQFSYNSMSQATEITYQGMDSKAVLFLIDGERISGEGGANNIDYSRFNIDNIERIEVVRGAASTLYDSRAIGGVINIIMKKSVRPIDAGMRMRYAGINGQSYQIYAGINHKKFSSMSVFGYRKRDTYTIRDTVGKVQETVKPDGTKTITKTEPDDIDIYGYRIIDFSQKFGYQFNHKISAELRGNYYANIRPTLKGKMFYQRYADFVISGRVKWQLTDNQKMEFSYIRDNYEKTNIYNLVDLKEHIYRNVNHTGRIFYSGNFGRHTLSGGIDFFHEKLKHYFMRDTSAVSMNQFSASLQEEWRITDNIDLVAGFRGDKGLHYAFNLTPKISMFYRPFEWLSIRAGYSQGYRIPNLKELYQEFNMGGVIMMYGNPDLKSERGSQISCSIEYNSGSLNVALSGYHNRYTNKISYEYIDPSQSYNMRYANASNVKTSGVEATLNYYFPFGLRLSGAYAYVDDYNKREGYNQSWLRPHNVRFNALYKLRIGKTTESLAINSNWVSQITRYSYQASINTYTRTNYDPRLVCSVNLRSQLPRGINIGFTIDNILNYKDKAADSAVQLPQNGVSYILTMSMNLADMFKW